MFIYNITIKVDWQIHEEWMEWIINTFIPDIMQTNCFEKKQFTRLHEVEESDGPTYALQFYALSKAQYNRYMQLYANSIMQHAQQAWKNQMLFFSTLMEVID